MADPSNSLAAQAAAALAELPLCVQAAAQEAVLKSSCGVNIACVCKEIGYEFISLLSASPSVKKCSLADLGATLQAVPKICGDAVPSLKESRRRETDIAVATMMVLAIIAVILRLVSRKISNARFGLDDLFIVLGVITSTGLSIASLVASHYGAGRHMIMLSIDQITKFSKSSFIAQLLFGLSITATKLSLLFFYHRVFPIRTVTIISIITGIFMVCWCIILVCLVTFMCRPVKYAWDKTIPNGRCLNSNTVYVSLAACNIVTDLVVLVLPMRWLAGLQLDLSKRLAVIATFILGGFVCVAGFLRVPFILEFKTKDVTWTVVHLAIWINVECNIGIVCTCLPVMRTLVQKLQPLFLRSHFSRSRSGYGSQKGSTRLTDSENSRISQKKTVTSTVEGVGTPRKSMDKGGSKGKNNSWFSNKRPLRNDDDMMGSMEEMVPIGQIAVQHDIEWINAPVDKH